LGKTAAGTRDLALRHKYAAEFGEIAQLVATVNQRVFLRLGDRNTVAGIADGVFQQAGERQRAADVQFGAGYGERRGRAAVRNAVFPRI